MEGALDAVSPQLAGAERYATVRAKFHCTTDLAVSRQKTIFSPMRVTPTSLPLRIPWIQEQHTIGWGS